MSNNEDTCRLTLRGIWRWTSTMLYELKSLTGLPIYELINRAVVYFVWNHPNLLQVRLKEVRRIVEEYGVKHPDQPWRQGTDADKP